MSLTNYFQKYKEEIGLIQIQNPVECELYSIIAYIIRNGKQSDNISLRDFSIRRKSKRSIPYRGELGFPDFIIFKREKTEYQKHLGAIEVKYVGFNLDSHFYSKQLESHRCFYNKVIYTNGLEWRFYNKDKADWNWRVILGKNINNEIIWYDEKWYCLLKELDKINWMENV